MVVNAISVALQLVGVIALIYYLRRLFCLKREYKDTKRSKKDGVFMAVECKGNDEPDQDTKRWKTDGILTTVGYNGGSEPDRDRKESNWWCSCGNCPVMQTDEESLCCRELTRCREIQTNGCIVDSKEFKDVCLNKSLMNTFLTFRSKDHKILGNTENQSYRFAAYRLWSDYVHGSMGKGVRRPLPACVVTRVRQEFPEETGVYVGFEYGNRGEKEPMCRLPEQCNEEHPGDSSLNADTGTE
ncbi:P2X purinoceptor 7-like [Lytechinus pictus]|uniref:P2X purinoceptor 7-like n=1 Tax=Lytechinus pictus TaxID=7653 RepID=UPI0030B9ECEF